MYSIPDIITIEMTKRIPKNESWKSIKKTTCISQHKISRIVLNTGKLLSRFFLIIKIIMVIIFIWLI